MKKALLLFVFMAILGMLPGNAIVHQTMMRPGQSYIDFCEAPSSVKAEDPSQDSRASGSMTFSYSGTPEVALRTTDVGAQYAVAMGLDQKTTTMLAGNKITQVIICSGSNMKDVTVDIFVTEDLKDISKCTSTQFKDDWTYHTITLPAPVEIKANTTLYIGFSGKQESADQFPCVFDRTPNSNALAFLFSSDISTGRWDNCQDDGAFCEKLVIEGDNLPEDKGSVTVSPIDFLKSNCESQIEFSVTNLAANTIESFEVEVSLKNQSPITKSYSTSIENYKESKKFLIPYTPDQTGVNLPLQINLLSINGKPLAEAQSSTTYTTCFDPENFYRKNMVVEEGTGTWCGFCPRGIVGMESMMQNHPDGTFIPIAIHSGDEMSISEYPSPVNSYPGALINRSKVYGTVSPFDYELESLYEKVSNKPSFARLDLSVTRGDNDKTFIFKTSTHFSLDVNGNEFALAFAVTENNVGPYDQRNYYSGSSEEMGGWELKESTVSTLFNDVARGIHDLNGIDGSIPACAIKAGQWVEYEHKGKFIAVSNPDNCRFIAMLINKTTGEIENAVMANGLSQESSADGLQFYVNDKAVSSGESVTCTDVQIKEYGSKKMVTMAPKVLLGSSKSASNVMLTVTSLTGQSVQCCAGGQCEKGIRIEKKNLTIGAGDKLDLLFEYQETLVADAPLPTVEAKIEAWYNSDSKSKQEIILRMSPATGIELTDVTGQAVRPGALGLEYSLEGTASVDVYDMNGKQVMSRTVNGKGVIYTADLLPGLYFYKVSGSATLSGKFLR